jgi:adenine-specific DNA-methyltransferase
MIYIDPPYNTGTDKIYPDNFVDPLDNYLRLTGQKRGNGDLLTSNPETSGRYHSSWLSMMYPRLFLARQLLQDDGIIFISIDDNELHNLRMLMNEIFGEENFIDNIIWKKRYGGGAKEKFLVTLHEYILFYAKNKATLDPIFIPHDPEAIERYYKLRDDKYEIRGPYRTHPLEATKSMGERKNLIYAIIAPDGNEVWPQRQWLWKEERTLRAIENNEIEFLRGKDGWTVHTKQYLNDEEGNERLSKAFSMIDKVYTQHGTNEIIEIFGDIQIFPFPKPKGLIEPLLNIGTSPNGDEIIMDFFAGSCTTAHAILELNRKDSGNRRFIMVQLPEATGRNDFPRISEIGKERIRRVISKLNKEKEGKLDLNERETPEDLGFKVFKLAESNYKQWAGVEEIEPEAYINQMELFTDSLVEGWQPEKVVWEVALKEGYGLNSFIERVAEVSTNTIYRVSDPDKGQSFFICLDDSLMISAVTALGLGKNDLFICRDAALNDEIAANLALQCRLKTI